LFAIQLLHLNLNKRLILVNNTVFNLQTKVDLFRYGYV
jgi:hypothetical protein